MAIRDLFCFVAPSAPCGALVWQKNDVPVILLTVSAQGLAQRSHPISLTNARPVADQMSGGPIRMSSVSSVNPGLTDLFQTLSSVDPQLLSSQTLVTALQNAPPSDIVELSASATELQSVDTLFGITDPSSTASTSDNLLATLETSLTQPQNSTANSPDPLLANTALTADPSSLIDLLG